MLLFSLHSVQLVVQMLDWLFPYPVFWSLFAAVLSLLVLQSLSSAMKNRLPLPGKHVFIGGGSQGLGLALACLLASKGANVTIVARSQVKLDAALEEVKKHRKTPSQKLYALAADLSTAESTSRAFDGYSEVNNIPSPEYVFACAGGAGHILGYFVDLSPEQLAQGWRTNYETSLWTAHAAAKRMIAGKVNGKIVLVSSVLGLFSFAGYSAYSPAKHALRGLADTLRNEFLLFGITIHCYFPATILSPGYEEEEKTKPALTKKIEGPDEGQTPEQCASKLLKGDLNKDISS
ncbi:MAG: 3-dehydrosphinganine reductase [Cyphobasidiales sp. Tagirdzhanova-0007]|nr:MAG: 3-dehydrosphinganine reductase [Cyphobasidiales sp. Tagirdzhanova-0007]